MQLFSASVVLPYGRVCIYEVWKEVYVYQIDHQLCYLFEIGECIWFKLAELKLCLGLFSFSDEKR